MAKRAIVLFGGTFDPVHLGHTTVAAEAAEHIGAEKVIFIPAKRSPLKLLSPVSGDDDRLKMIALAVKGKKNFQTSDYELQKSEPSYTLGTVRKFQADYGSGTLIYWLTGADSINELPHWYKITELLDSCILSVMYRAGFEPPNFAKLEPLLGPQRVEKLQKNIIQTSLIDISSTEIRNRLTAGLDVADMIDPAVADYICQHGLYQSK